MKLLRFGIRGDEKPGLLGPDGTIRGLSGFVKDITGETLTAASLAKLGTVDPKTLPAAPQGVRLGPPVANVRSFIGVGFNYSDHAKEAGAPIPTEPIIFFKPSNSICGPNDDLMTPRGSSKLDWEVEIAFVVGKRARYVELSDAANHIAGYTICNEVSERVFQFERSASQWTKGKCAEALAPLGPWLVTPDEIADVNNLPMWLDVNGKRMQTGSTKTMIFNCSHLLHDISQYMVLEAGDVVTTGTPPGVGLGMKPQVFLKAGDVMTLGIEGLGQQSQKVVPFKL
jgi:2,4-diketo-3-deoxy-L-fuconate hydrolase